ncbi:MAG: hypothetical protein MAG458_00251 [Nitrosopumilus sp.]|nr:hypothetical protein [Nitrosopumilus sp.]
MNGNSKTKRKDDISCVQLSKSTKEKLDKLGTNRKDTYESIILRMMDSPCGSEPGVEEDEL